MGFLTILGTVFFFLLIISSVFIILSDTQDSGRKIAWLLTITILPAIGLLLYIIFGLNFRKARFFRRRHKTFLEIFENNVDERVKTLLFGHQEENGLKPEYRELAKLLSKGDGMTVSCGNEIEIITDGRRKLDALTQDILNAKHHIHMEYFYFRKDKGSMKIKELLMQKAREGVHVRFIHENIANIDIRPGYYNEMKRAGVEVVRFTNPASFVIAKLNYRDHRKIAVIDGKIGYTGGMNIGDDYFFRWRDTHMRMTGGAVAGLQYSFMNSFITSGGRITGNFNDYFPETACSNKVLAQIVPDEPEKQWPVLQMGAVWAAQHSRKYIYIQTPYFVPPEALLQSLKSAALKDCDVRLMLPAKTDMFYMTPANRSFYTECLEAGIRIFERTDKFIHAKTLVSDDYLSIIGSANMDYRSLELNYEINAYIYDENIAKENREIFLEDLKACREITLEKWSERAWYKQMWQSVIRLFAPLL